MEDENDKLHENESKKESGPNRKFFQNDHVINISVASLIVSYTLKKEIVNKWSQTIKICSPQWPSQLRT